MFNYLHKCFCWECREDREDIILSAREAELSCELCVRQESGRTWRTVAPSECVGATELLTRDSAVYKGPRFNVQGLSTRI